MRRLIQIPGLSSSLYVQKATHHFDLGVALRGLSRDVVGAACEDDGHGGRTNLGEVGAEPLVRYAAHGERVDAGHVAVTAARVLVHTTVTRGPDEQ